MLSTIGTHAFVSFKYSDRYQIPQIAKSSNLAKIYRHTVITNTLDSMSTAAPL